MCKKLTLLHNALPKTTGKMTNWTWKEQADMVKWSRSPIQASLLKFESPPINKLAIECFIGQCPSSL